MIAVVLPLMILIIAGISLAVYFLIIRKDGGYSDWKLTEECGEEGYLLEERKCDNPKPESGGEKCKGESLRSSDTLCPDEDSESEDSEDSESEDSEPEDSEPEDSEPEAVSPWKTKYYKHALQDHDGDDINEKGDPEAVRHHKSQKECEELCDKAPGCVAYNYKSKDKFCYLKKKSNNIKENDHYDIYTKSKYQKNASTDHFGDDIDKGGTQRAVKYFNTPKECEDLCDNAPGCIAYNYNNTRQYCYLKKKADNKIHDVRTDLYVKNKATEYGKVKIDSDKASLGAYA